MASFLVVSQQTLTSHATRKIPTTKVALICSIWPLILWLINYSQQLTREIWLCLAIEEALTRRDLYLHLHIPCFAGLGAGITVSQYHSITLFYVTLQTSTLGFPRILAFNSTNVDCPHLPRLEWNPQAHGAVQTISLCRRPHDATRSHD